MRCWALTGSGNPRWSRSSWGRYRWLRARYGCSASLLDGPTGGSVTCPQRRSFDPSLRVRGRDIVRLGVDGHRWGLPLPQWLPGATARRAAAGRVEEVIDLVGAGAYADRPVGELSGGEQQRLLIAQALAPAPELLLLDEPLDSLDLPNQAAVAALIARISRAQGVALVIVAHDVNPILSHLDTVVYLAPGGSMISSPREVITGAALTRLVGAPIEVLTASDGRLVVIGLRSGPVGMPTGTPSGSHDAGRGSGMEPVPGRHRGDRRRRHGRHCATAAVRQHRWRRCRPARDPGPAARLRVPRVGRRGRRRGEPSRRRCWCSGCSPHPPGQPLA